MNSPILTGSEKTVFGISDDEGTTLAEMAVAIQLTPSEARELALRLQAKGLVEVGEDQNIRLTTEGRKIRRSLERNPIDDIRTTAIGTLVRDILVISLGAGIATFFRYYVDLSFWLSILLGIILPLIAFFLGLRMERYLHRKSHPGFTRPAAGNAASYVAETKAKGLEHALDEAFERLKEPATTGKGK